MDENRGKVLFVLMDSTGKYGPLYRQQFFVSQPGERQCCTPFQLHWDAPSERRKGSASL